MQPIRLSWDLLFLLNLSEVPVQLDLSVFWNPGKISASFSWTWVTVFIKSQIWNPNSTKSDGNVSIDLNSQKKSDNILKGFCFPEVGKWSGKSDLHTSVSAPAHTCRGYHRDCWKTGLLRFFNITFTSTSTFLPKTPINWMGPLLVTNNSRVILIFMAQDIAYSLYFKWASGNNL